MDGRWVDLPAAGVKPMPSCTAKAFTRLYVDKLQNARHWLDTVSIYTFISGYPTWSGFMQAVEDNHSQPLVMQMLPFINLSPWDMIWIYSTPSFVKNQADWQTSGIHHLYSTHWYKGFWYHTAQQPHCGCTANQVSRSTDSRACVDLAWRRLWTFYMGKMEIRVGDHPPFKTC